MDGRHGGATDHMSAYRDLAKRAGYARDPADAALRQLARYAGGVLGTCTRVAGAYAGRMATIISNTGQWAE